MIIEFIGLPGAGKSSITNSLLDNLKIPEIRKYQNLVKELPSNAARRISFLRFMVVNSTELFPLLIKALKNSTNKRYTITRLQKLAIMLHNLKSHKESDILIMDQGLVQMLISIFQVHNQTETAQLSKLWNTVIKNIQQEEYKIIYIKTPIAVAVDRIMHRDKIDCKFKRMNSKNRTQTLTAYSQALEEWKVDLICNAETEIKYNVKIISDFILNC